MIFLYICFILALVCFVIGDGGSVLYVYQLKRFGATFTDRSPLAKLALKSDYGIHLIFILKIVLVVSSFIYGGIDGIIVECNLILLGIYGTYTNWPSVNFAHSYFKAQNQIDKAMKWIFQDMPKNQPKSD